MRGAWWALIAISDGTSNTMLFAESAGRHQVYDGTSFDSGCSGVNATNGGSAGVYQIYAFHSGGANVRRTDRSVQFLRDAIAPATLVSRAGGEVVSDD